MKSSPFLDNLKKYFKQKIVLVNEKNEYIDFETGEILNKKNTLNAILIYLTQAGWKSSKNKLHYKYQIKIEKNNQIHYFGTNKISLIFLQKILSEKYNKKAFILKGIKKSILLFGNNYKIVDNQNLEEEKSVFFQGIEPKEVNFYNLIKELTPTEYKKIIIFVVMFFILILLIISMFSSSEEEIFIPSNNINFHKKHKKRIKHIKLTNKNKIDALLTNYFIYSLFHSKDLLFDSVYIKNISFYSHTVIFNSLIPLRGYHKRDFLYSREVKFIPEKTALENMYLSYKFKDFKQCKKIIQSYTPVIYSISENGDSVTYYLKKDMSPVEITMFLNQIYSCPVVIRGNINTKIIEKTGKNKYKSLFEKTDLKISLINNKLLK